LFCLSRLLSLSFYPFLPLTFYLQLPAPLLFGWPPNLTDLLHLSGLRLIF
jgi:hypothetical protein